MLGWCEKAEKEINNRRSFRGEGLFPCYCDLLLFDESVAPAAEERGSVCVLAGSRAAGGVNSARELFLLPKYLGSFTAEGFTGITPGRVVSQRDRAVVDSCV